MKKQNKAQPKQLMDSLISLITKFQIPLVALLLFYVIYSNVAFMN